MTPAAWSLSPEDTADTADTADTGEWGFEHADVEWTALLSVALEPGMAPIEAMPDGSVAAGLRGPEEQLPALVQLVADAERHGHRLTLLATPQWVKWLKAPSCTAIWGSGTVYCRTRVGHWLSAGHRIGLHHNGCGPWWDGLSDEPSCGDYPRPGDLDKGINQVLGLMGQPVATAELSDDAWPDKSQLVAILAGGQATSRLPDRPADLASVPCVRVSGEGLPAWEVRQRRFHGEGSRQSLLDNELNLALHRGWVDQDYGVLGHSTTVSFYSQALAHDGAANFTRLFEDLADDGIGLAPVREAVETWTPQAGPPTEDDVAMHLCEP